MKKLLRGAIDLPGSKSESNRALMIAAYGGFPLQVKNLSEANDTLLLKKLLETTSSTVDCQDAGTVARFLMTYLAGKSGTWLLTGTKRLCERPMTPLIDALRQLGADIEGDRLPLKIIGKPLKGGHVTLDASQSSQFVSSLLLAAPMWEQGLDLELVGELTSVPYIDMTLSMMHQFGIDAVRDGKHLVAHPKPYQQGTFEVSPDWSAASYWYEMMALGDGGDLLLKGLKFDSLQGDAVVAEWFKQLGIATSFDGQGAHLTKVMIDSQELVFDVTDTPDLFPAIFVTCVAKSYRARFQGIRNLSKKESNRVDSLITELSKIYKFNSLLKINDLIIEKSIFYIDIINNNKVLFNTYHDHRVEMALAPLMLLADQICFDDDSVVTKSYPTFWEDMKKIGVLV
jgi:3-phosphoshikimate 1-carboxyvinyltransferase